MDLDTAGFTILPSVMAKDRCDSIWRDIVATMAATIESRRGSLVGGRNLLSVWSGWREITSKPMVADLVARHVGSTAGLVRILCFDKPPGQSWSLALHRDKTIAVAEHPTPASPFAKPTRKAGVPHVEANDELLSQMLTLRLHLDAMQEDNGPLIVAPGSHLDDISLPDTPQVDRPKPSTVTIQTDAGDMFAMRPLLLHGSLAASATSKCHRRVVHLEIAPSDWLPEPYRWHHFSSLQ